MVVTPVRELQPRVLGYVLAFLTYPLLSCLLKITKSKLAGQGRPKKTFHVLVRRLSDDERKTYKHINSILVPRGQQKEDGGAKRGVEERA